MRISDWSSDVCSSDLTGCLGHRAGSPLRKAAGNLAVQRRLLELSATLASTALNTITAGYEPERPHSVRVPLKPKNRSEEHTSELQSLMRSSYAVFCLKKKKGN